MDQPNKRYFVSEQHLVDKILTRFNMEEIATRAIPADPKIRLSAATNTKSEGEESNSFREHVGALLYMALKTRPDTLYVK